MTIEINDEFTYYIHKRVIPSALGFLPGKMDSPEARAMLLAIGLQESRFMHRVQVGGPARGYWQFEKNGGVKGVLTHVSTAPIIFPLLRLMNYREMLSSPIAAQKCYTAIAYDDVLACVFARLLLWTVPGKLATHVEEARAWTQYINGWRPGKPHPDTWSECFAIAWRHVLNE